MEEIAQGFDKMEFFNDITELTAFAGKSNNGNESFVLVACISVKHVDMIVFSNNPIEGDFSFQYTSSYDREKFGRWFKTLIKDVGDSEDDIGTVEGKALYGINGRSGGSPSLELAGWRWNKEPRPTDKTKEDGRLVFEIKVDDNGEVISVRTLLKTVSPVIEQLLSPGS